MCQATVYYEQEDGEHEILREVVYMERTDEGWVVNALFEEPKTISGRIDSIDFLKHTVTLSREDS